MAQFGPQMINRGDDVGKITHEKKTFFENSYQKHNSNSLNY